MIMQFFTILLFTTVYAVMRYALFGNVSLIHLPVYLMNKSISMAAAVSLFMAALGLMRARQDMVRFWSKACSHSAFIHVFLSFGILSKGYFPKFFDNDKMNLTGEAVLLMGVLALFCFWRLGANEMKPAARRTLTWLASALVAGHLFVMGRDGWLQVQKWHGGLPPITLLSFCLVVYSMTIFLRGKEEGLSSSPAEGRIEQEGFTPKEIVSSGAADSR